MAVSNVELIVNAVKAINPLRKVKQQSEQVDQAFKKTQRAARNVEAAFLKMGRNGIRNIRDLEANAAKLGKRMSGLRGTIAKVTIGFAAFSAAQTGIQRAESERRIKFLAESYGEVAQLQDAATKAAKRFGTGQTEANRALADVFARLRPVGVSLQDIVSVYNGFNTAAKISGSTAVEASNAFRQLSQALGSGALRGDEFNSISEQVPGILTAISKETGVAQGQLRKFAAEGGITADIVIRALKRIETEGAAQLQEALGGPAQAIADFQNATEDVQVALTETVIPELSKSFVILAEIINDLKPVIQAVGSFAAKVLGGIANTIERIRDPNKLAAEQQAFFAEGKMRGRMRRGQRGLANLPANYKEQEAALFAAAATPSVSTLPTLPTLPTLKDKVTGTKTRGRSAEDILKDQLAAGERIEEQLRRQIALRQADGELQRQILQINFDLQDTLKNINKNAADSQKEMLTNLARFDSTMKAARAAQQSFNKFFQDQQKQAELFDQAQERFKKFFKDSTKQTDTLKEALQGVGDILGNQLMNVFDGLINKTVDFNDVLRSTLAQVGKLLMTAGLNQLAGSDGVGILSFLGFGTRANGGPVASGRPYVVGERGPELFMPQQSGSIRSNEDLRALMGRSPAGAGSQPAMNFTFETTNIGGQEFVSREQLEAAMATTRRQAANDGAKRGMNMTLDRMQNSPRTRARVGIS